MNTCIHIGIIGDYDGRPSHLATQDALQHSAFSLDLEMNYQWIPTETLEQSTELLDHYDGIWCSPGSPYQSMNGAIEGIRYAREHDLPFLGTCGGFQHAVIEYGRNILRIKALEDRAFDLYTPNDYITSLSCSLAGQTKKIMISERSKVSSIYSCREVFEKYNCNFGLGKNFQTLLHESGFRITGADEDGDVRMMELPEKRFYIGTLFQPQLSSTAETPHPLILEYLRSAAALHCTRNHIN